MTYGYGDKIFMADDLAHEKGYTNSKDHISDRLRALGLPELAEKSRAKPSGDMEIEAYIAQSRLVADCPACNGSMAANRDDEGFFCMTCHNYMNFNLPIKLKVSSQLSKVERELLKRKFVRNRNWGHPATQAGRKRETIKELQAEPQIMKGIK